MERLLKVPEVAARLSVSRTTAYQWILEGSLPSLKIAGVRRVRESDLDQWIRRQAEEQAPVAVA